MILAKNPFTHLVLLQSIKESWPPRWAAVSDPVNQAASSSAGFNGGLSFIALSPFLLMAFYL